VGEVHLRKYGTGTGADVYVTHIKRGVVDFAVGADWTPAAGDVKVSKDGGVAANIGTLPTAIAMGNTAIWKYVFADAELQAAFLKVTISDSATKAVEDDDFTIETYGNASALHAFDLDDAQPTVDIASGGIIVGAFAASSITAAAIATDAIDADALADGAITALTFAAGAIDAAAIAADAIGSSELAASAVTEIQAGLSTLDAAGVRTAVGLASANLDTQLDAVATPADILTTALTEAYAADGVAPTLSQLLFLVLAALTEFAISGTTITAKKLDGVTTAATYTLDDGTNPTSRTRAT